MWMQHISWCRRLLLHRLLHYYTHNQLVRTSALVYAPQTTHFMLLCRQVQRIAFFYNQEASNESTDYSLHGFAATWPPHAQQPKQQQQQLFTAATDAGWHQPLAMVKQLTNLVLYHRSAKPHTPHYANQYSATIRTLYLHRFERDTQVASVT
jgi:hypothetical protein